MKFPVCGVPTALMILRVVPCVTRLPKSGQCADIVGNHVAVFDVLSLARIVRICGYLNAVSTPLSTSIGPTLRGHELRLSLPFA